MECEDLFPLTMIVGSFFAVVCGFIAMNAMKYFGIQDQTYLGATLIFVTYFIAGLIGWGISKVENH